MEIAFDLSEIFTENIQRLNRAQLIRFDPRRYWAVAKCIDELGRASAKSQGLKRIITSYENIVDQDDEQVVYLMWSNTDKMNSKLIGLLKIGYKKLYLTDSVMNQYEERALCILDFFVIPEEQRKGNGSKLFDNMLKNENISAEKCAFDSPSGTLQQFLIKNYGLQNPIWQSTKIVVYSDFFAGCIPTIVNTPRSTGRISRAGSATSSAIGSRNCSPIGRNRPRHDSVADLMRYDSVINEQSSANPETPTGRKNKRDYGHTRIW